jgi:hypothetical protein
MDLIVGRIIEASDHPGARAPSYLLRVDAGPRGLIEAQMEPGGSREGRPSGDARGARWQAMRAYRVQLAEMLRWVSG